MIYMFDARVKAAVSADIANITAQLSEGHAQSYEEYKFKVGILRGLRMALQSLDEIAITLKDQ